jgi:hypothetical protein
MNADDQKQEISQMLREIHNKEGLNIVKKISFRTVDYEEAQNLKRDIGLELFGYEHKITNSDIKHIFDKHGDQLKESLQGQIAVKDEDILLIPEITKNYDCVLLSPETVEQKRVLIYEKRIGNKYYYLETVGGKNNKELRTKSMWIHK